MSLRSCSAILAIAIGVSTMSGAQAVEVSNGLTSNGLTSNGLTSNGLTSNGLTSNGLTSNGVSANGQDAQGHRDTMPSRSVALKAVVLQDGSTITLR